MPRLGVSVTEGTLSTWLKAVGDEVAVGEPICEVATDKVDTEIESTVAGVLAEQRYAEGDTVPVGEPLAVVTAAREQPAAVPEPVAAETEPVAAETEPVAVEPESTAAPAVEVPPPSTPSAGAGLVLMPRLGVSVTEGTVLSWLKSVGDRVEEGEPICEVATDKVDTEIESTVAGVLAEQRYAEGEVVPVGEPLAVVTTDGALTVVPTAAPTAASAAAPTPTPTPIQAAPELVGEPIARPSPAPRPCSRQARSITTPRSGGCTPASHARAARPRRPPPGAWPPTWAWTSRA